MSEEQIRIISKENVFIGDEPNGIKGDEVIYRKGVLGRYEGRIYAWCATAGGAYRQHGLLEILGPEVDIADARFHGRLTFVNRGLMGIYYFIRFDDSGGEDSFDE